MATEAAVRQFKYLCWYKAAIQARDPMIIAGCSSDDLQRIFDQCCSEIISLQPIVYPTLYAAQPRSAELGPQAIHQMVNSVASSSLANKNEEEQDDDSDSVSSCDYDIEEDKQAEKYIKYLENSDVFTREEANDCSLEILRRFYELDKEYMRSPIRNLCVRSYLPFLLWKGKMEEIKEYCDIRELDFATNLARATADLEAIRHLLPT